MQNIAVGNSIKGCMQSRATASTKIMGNSDILKCWQCELKNVKDNLFKLDVTAMGVILGTLRYMYLSADTNGNVMAEEGLGIEHFVTSTSTSTFF